MKNPLKLYIYRIEGEKILVDTQECEDFGEFVLVAINAPSGMRNEEIEQLQNSLTEAFEDKKILILDKSLDIAFYGIEKEKVIELKNDS